MPADEAAGWRAMAQTRLDSRRFLDALKAARLAVSAAPREAAGYTLVGEIALAMADLPLAVEALEAAYSLAPESRENAELLATAHLRSNNPPRALAFAQLAAALAPTSADAQALVGSALVDLRRPEEARAAFAAALALDPHHPHAQNGLGAAAEFDGDDATALAYFEAALAHHPTFAEARMNRALVLIRAGRFREGYRDYHAMMSTPARAAGYPYARMGKRRWRGEPLLGRRLLIAQEQGFGDMVQMLRYVPHLAPLDGPVAFEVKSPLVPLVRRSFPDLTLVEDAGLIADPASFDVHLPVMQLPAVFGSTLETLPATFPYLRPDADRAERLRARLAVGGGITVGIAWRGNPSHRGDTDRSTSLADWAPLTGLDGVRFISLQYGASPEELAAAPFPLEAPPMTIADFDDSAVLIAAVDAVVSVDTVAIHLAGALGRPAFLALPWRADYRWMRGRPDTPWYASVQLVRQAAPGDWASVFTTISSQLRGLAASPR